MGYESKIIVVERHQHDSFVFGDELARFDLCKMGYDFHDGKQFRNLFTVPVDFDLYVNQSSSSEEETEDFYRVDKYGEHCKYTTDIDGVIGWLELSEAHDHYRRAALLLDFLRVLKSRQNEYGQLVLVHFGH